MRILVTYGYHIGENFAKEVGIKFQKLNLENTITVGLKGEKPFPDYNDPNCIFKEWEKSYRDWRKGKIVYPEDLALLRRKVDAKYGIDLHDNSAAREWVLQHSEDEIIGSIYPGYKYDLVGHMGFERAKKLVLGFKRHWNTMRGIKETSDSDVSSFGCDCYYLTYHMHKPCRANIISLEYNTVFTDLTIKEAVNSLKELIKYLKSNDRSVL
jgi:hypothetical protein